MSHLRLLYRHPDISVISGVSHLFYSLIQLSMIFSLCNPLELGVVNVMKRIIIIVGIYLYHQEQWTLVNIFSSLLCILITFTGSVLVLAGDHDQDVLNCQNYSVKRTKSSKLNFGLVNDYFVV